MKRLFLSLFGLFSINCYAAIGSGVGGLNILNTNTLQPNATFYVSSGTVTNLQTKTIKFSDGSTQTTAASGGSGASALSVFVNGVQVSSPTSKIAFDSNFIGTQSPTGVSNITLNPGTTLYIQNTNSLQTGSTFYVSSATIRGPTSILNSTLQALFLPTSTETFSLVNVSSYQVYVLFKASGTAWWRVGNDVTNLKIPEFDIYNATTGIKDIAISTNDVATINAGVILPNLSVSQPVHTNSNKQLITGLISLTGDVTGTLPSTNLPSNVAYTNVSQTFSGTNVFTSSQTFTNGLASSNLTSGQCLQTGTNGLLTVTGFPCGAGGGGDVFKASTQTFTGSNTFAGPFMTITSSKTYFNATGNFGVNIGSTPQTTAAAYLFDVSNSTSNGVTIYDNSTKSQGGGSMLTLIATNTVNHAFNMRIFRNNAGNSNGDIRVDSPDPNFEFVDITQDGGTSSWGKFEVPSINSDHCNITGRNGANTAFENIAGFNRIGGAFGGGMILYSTCSLKFSNTVGSYVGFRPGNTFTDSGSWLWTLPLTMNNTGQVMTQISASPTFQLAFSTGGTPGQVLTNNGANGPVWANAGGASTSPGGANSNVQINSSGSFYGDSGFQYDSSVSSITLTGNLGMGSTLNITGSSPFLNLFNIGPPGGYYNLYENGKLADQWGDYGSSFQILASTTTSGTYTAQPRILLDRTSRKISLVQDSGLIPFVQFDPIGNSSFTIPVVLGTVLSASSLATDSTGKIIAGSGGGSSSLAVGTGTASNFTTNVTSPTAAISFEGAQFTSKALGTTNYIALNQSSVTLQGVFTAGSGILLTPSGTMTTISATGGGGGSTAILGSSSTVLTTSQSLSTGFTTITGSTLTFVVGTANNRAQISFTINVIDSFAGGWGDFTIILDGVNLGSGTKNGIVQYGPGSGTASGASASTVFLTAPLSAGSHTFYLQGQEDALNSASLTCSTDGCPESVLEISSTTGGGSSSSGGGSSIYPATSTASFPFGFLASTGNSTGKFVVGNSTGGRIELSATSGFPVLNMYAGNGTNDWQRAFVSSITNNDSMLEELTGSTYQIYVASNDAISAPVSRLLVSRTTPLISLVDNNGSNIVSFSNPISTFSSAISISSIAVSQINLLNQGNTRVVFMNGTQLGTSSTYTWNGTTMTATIVNPTSSFQVGGGSFTVKTNGNWNVNGSSPTLSSCGASPSVIGGGLVFTITAGSGANGCTATFANPLINTPTCNITAGTGSVINTFSYTTSNTGVVITETGLSGNIDVQCVGHDKN